MSDIKNYFSIDGTLYAKNTRTVTGKKDPSQTYEFKSIILEVKNIKKVKTNDGKFIEKTFSELPEFDLGYGVDDSQYEVGDAITVKFSVEGREYKGGDGQKRIMTKLKAVFLKFTDINGKPAKAQEEDVFAPPDPTISDDMEGLDNLPF